MKTPAIKFCGLLAALLFIGIQALPAQERDIQYVTDKLRLSLYADADQSSDVIKLLQSGDSLEIEQIQGPYAYVVAEDGTRGWVKRGFLVEEPTSNLLLSEALEQIDNLEAEIEKLANSKIVIDQYEADMDQLVVKIDTLEKEKLDMQAELEQFRQQQARARLAAAADSPAQGEATGESPLVSASLVATAGVDLREIGAFALGHWKLLAPILAILIVIVFLVSKVIVESRIKSRFHGIKIW